MLTQFQSLNGFLYTEWIVFLLYLFRESLMPALRAALLTFQINILYSLCVQGLLCYFESIAFTACLYGEKKMETQ